MKVKVVLTALCTVRFSPVVSNWGFPDDYHEMINGVRKKKQNKTRLYYITFFFFVRSLCQVCLCTVYILYCIYILLLCLFSSFSNLLHTAEELLNYFALFLIQGQ